MRSWSSVIVSVGIGLGGITAPARAVAAGPEGDAALRTVEARRRYQEGNAAMKLHQWQRAYEAYLQAWRQRPHWQVAGSLGEVELTLGKSGDAANHLAFFLHEAKDVSPEETKRVREWLAQARAAASRLTLTTAPPGAEILVDGVAIGPAPWRDEVYVEPGKHVVTGRQGACAATASVEVGAGQSQAIALRCEPTTPDQKSSAAAAQAGPTGQVAPSPEHRTVLIAGVSVTAASLGLGLASVALFTVKGHRAKENGESAAGPNATAEATFKSVALWSFVAAGVAASGTLAYEITIRRAGRPPVRGSVVVGPTGAAAMVQGGF
jgi:hypothetical protein